MKTIKPLLLASVLLLFCSLFSHAQSPDFNHQITIEIKPSKKSDTTTEPKPRSLVESDIEGYYYGGVATFIFNRDLGDADIVVSNLTTGEQWHNSLSGIGSTSVVLSGDSGDYDVAIYTDNGDYYGYFTL